MASMWRRWRLLLAQKEKGASTSSVVATVVSTPWQKISKELIKESSKNKKETIGGQMPTGKRIQFAIVETLNKSSWTDGLDSGKDKEVASNEKLSFHSFVVDEEEPFCV